MSKIEDELYKKLNYLEKERIAYLEADDNRGAKRYEKKMREVEKEIDLINLNKLQKEIKIYKDFIKKRNLLPEFQKYCEELKI